MKCMKQTIETIRYGDEFQLMDVNENDFDVHYTHFTITYSFFIRRPLQHSPKCFSSFSAIATLCIVYTMRSFFLVIHLCIFYKCNTMNRKYMKRKKHFSAKCKRSRNRNNNNNNSMSYLYLDWVIPIRDTSYACVFANSFSQGRYCSPNHTCICLLLLSPSGCFSLVFAISRHFARICRF